MKNILIDTDILINFLRGREKARDYLASLINEATLYCSAITVAEIFAGMHESEHEETAGLIDSLNVISVTREIAEKAGRYKNAHKGHSLELDDCIIAASASVKNAVLATGNDKHYPMKDIQRRIVK